MLINLSKMPQKIKVASCPTGTGIKKVYKYEYNEKYGCPRRVLNGTIDLKEYIQQNADSVDFAAIGKMLVDTRDNVIDHFSIGGEVFDQTALPRNIHEYEALHNKMKSSFEGLSPEVKSLFGDDFGVFAKVWQSGNIKKVLSGVLSPKKQPMENNSVEFISSTTKKEG